MHRSRERRSLKTLTTMISVTGHKEIDEVLKHLPSALQDSVVSSAHLKAAKITVEREKLLAPEGPTGNLVDSIGATRTPFKKANRIGEVIVGPRRKGRFKGFAGHLVEYGTRKRNKSGPNRGVMPRHPFAKPAFEQTRNAIKDSIKGNLSKIVIKAMKRYAPK